MASYFASVSEWSKEFDSSSNLVRGMGSNPIGSTFSKNPMKRDERKYTERDVRTCLLTMLDQYNLDLENVDSAYSVAKEAKFLRMRGALKRAWEEGVLLCTRAACASYRGCICPPRLSKQWTLWTRQPTGSRSSTTVTAAPPADERAGRWLMGPDRCSARPRDAGQGRPAGLQQRWPHGRPTGEGCGRGPWDPMLARSRTSACSRGRGENDALLKKWGGRRGGGNLVLANCLYRSQPVSVL